MIRNNVFLIRNRAFLVGNGAFLTGELLKAPGSGDDLPHSRFTRRKKELFDFPAEDSGKTVYFCVRYENAKG